MKNSGYSGHPKNVKDSIKSYSTRGVPKMLALLG
jgi:hypothetical protein